MSDSRDLVRIGGVSVSNVHVLLVSIGPQVRFNYLVVRKSVSFYQVCPAAVRDEVFILHPPDYDSGRDSYFSGEVLDLGRGREATQRPRELVRNQSTCREVICLFL